MKTVPGERNQSLPSFRSRFESHNNCVLLERNTIPAPSPLKSKFSPTALSFVWQSAYIIMVHKPGKYIHALCFIDLLHKTKPPVQNRKNNIP